MKKKPLTREQMFSMWEEDEKALFRFHSDAYDFDSTIRQFRSGNVLLQNDRIWWTRRGTQTYLPEEKPSPADELHTLLDAVMQGVTKENAIEKAQEAYALKAEWFPRIGWKEARGLSGKNVCPLCAAHQNYGCNDCPLGLDGNGPCCNEYRSFKMHPSPATFAALKQRIDALTAEPEVQPGQVWEHNCGNVWLVVGEDKKVCMKDESRDIVCRLGCDAASEMARDYSHTLTDRRVVTIGPDEEIISKGTPLCPRCTNKPEPTLSYKYVKEHAGSCDDWAHWYLTRCEEHRMRCTALPLKKVLTLITLRNEKRFLSAVSWLIDHGLIDSALQITGESK